MLESKRNKVQRFQLKAKYLHYSKDENARKTQAKADNIFKILCRQRSQQQTRDESIPNFNFTQPDINEANDQTDQETYSPILKGDRQQNSGLDSIRKVTIPSTLNSTLKLVQDSPRDMEKFKQLKNSVGSIKEEENDDQQAQQELLVNEHIKRKSESQSALKTAEKLPLISQYTNNSIHGANRSQSMHDKTSINDSSSFSESKSPGRLLRRLHKKLTAITYLKRVLNEVKDKNFQQIFTLYEPELISCVQRKDIQVVIEITSKLMEICVDQNHILYFTQLCKFLGLYSKDLQDYNKSAFFFHQLKIIAEITNQLKEKSCAFLELAKVATNISQYETSIRLLKKGLQYSWKVDDLELELEFYEQIGINYYYMGDLEQARFYHNKYIKADNELVSSPLRQISIAIIDRIIQQPDYPIYTEFNRLFMFKISLPILNKFEIQAISLDDAQSHTSHYQCDTQKIHNYQNSKADNILNQIISEKEFVVFELDHPVYSRLREIQHQKKKQFDQLPSQFHKVSSQTEEVDFAFAERDRVLKRKIVMRPKVPKFMGRYESEEENKKKRKLPFSVADDPFKFKIPVEKQIKERTEDKQTLDQQMEMIKNKVLSNIRGMRSTSRQKIHISHKTDEKVQKIRSISTDAQILQKKYQLFFHKQILSNHK